MKKEVNNTKAKRVLNLVLFAGMSALTVISLDTPVASAQESSSDREARHAAFDSCATQVGLQKPAAGERRPALSDELRQKLDACLKEKGFDSPSHRGGEHHGPPPAEVSSEAQSSGGVE